MEFRIGVLSDTHLRRVTKEFEELYERYLADADMILHAGDIVSAHILDFLERKPFHAVYGNMDPVEVRRRLPDKEVVEVGPYRLGIIHGWGPAGGLEDRVFSQFGDVDVIVYGHSHTAANHVEGGVLLFNPGTATGYSSTGAHSLGLLVCDENIRGEIITL
jgi:putative phosphoesterase